jgi:hypothetical protein
MTTPTTAKPTIKGFADAAYTALAAADGKRHLPCAHGLNIVIEHTGDEWRLKLGRRDTHPSPIEINICRAAFRLRSDHPILYIENNGWRIVALTWRGPVPPPRTIPEPPNP